MMQAVFFGRRLHLAGVLLLVMGSEAACARDRPQWGARHSRNMVSDETDLPDSFDLESGRNIKWSVPLGTSCYSTPVVSAGRVLVGTNNGAPRDERIVGDRGVLMCFDQETGEFVWQLAVPKRD